MSGGSGVAVYDANRRFNEFEQMHSIVKKMKGSGMMKMLKKLGGAKGMKGLMGGGMPKLPF